MFSFIGGWINGWVNNREAADLRRHRAHYEVTAMTCAIAYRHNDRWRGPSWHHRRYSHHRRRTWHSGLTHMVVGVSCTDPWKARNPQNNVCNHQTARHTLDNPPNRKSAGAGAQGLMVLFVVEILGQLPHQLWLGRVGWPVAAAVAVATWSLLRIK